MPLPARIAALPDSIELTSPVALALADAAPGHRFAITR